MNTSGDAIIAGGKLIAVDRNNNRLLIWNNAAAASGTAADVVVGQPDMLSCAPNQGAGPTANSLNAPGSVISDGTNLLVADTLNNRILFWSIIPTTNNAPAEGLLGQPDFFTNTPGVGPDKFDRPHFMAANGEIFVVGDFGNNRVLVWYPSPEGGRPPDAVLGQVGYTSNAVNDTNGDGVGDAAPDAKSLNGPLGVVLNQDYLLVSDSLNHRILIYETQQTPQ